MNETEETKEYYNRTRWRNPAILLVEAIDYVGGKHALDLGAGALRDARYLLTKGFTVVAIDKAPVFDEEIRTIDNPRFSGVVSSFVNYDFPEQSFDMVNAQYSLPFNDPMTFLAIFEKMKASLVTGGIFVGQLFGKNDSWNNPKSKKTFHTKEDVENLLRGFDILKLVEIEKKSRTSMGEKKHWHYFDVIAKKL